MEYIMKTSPIILCIIAFSLALIGCSSDPPSVRVRNELLNKANVQFKPMSGNTININDVAAGTTTAYQEFPQGAIECSAAIQSSNDAPTGGFTTQDDYNYTVVLVNTTPATIRVDSEKK